MMQGTEVLGPMRPYVAKDLMCEASDPRGVPLGKYIGGRPGPWLRLLGCPVLRVLKGGVFRPPQTWHANSKSPALEERQGRGPNLNSKARATRPSTNGEFAG